jgi:hypothetical protein
VVSCSDSLSRREGWEEAATKWGPTMAMKLKTKNDGKNQMLPPSWRAKCRVVLRHFHRHCYRSSHYDSLFGGDFGLLVVS